MPATLPQKLQFKPGRRITILNSPPGYIEQLGELSNPVSTQIDPTNQPDIIQLFVANRQELEQVLPGLWSHLATGGFIWVTYHKGTSKIKTDINRDTINAYAHTLGLEGIAMISIDEDWSALRLREMAK